MQLHIFEIYSDPSECTNKTFWLGFKDLTDQFEITNHWEEDRQMFVAGLARFALTAVAPRKVLLITTFRFMPPYSQGELYWWCWTNSNNKVEEDDFRVDFSRAA